MMNAVPVLHTRRCVLREIARDEIPTLRQIVDDDLFQRFLPELYELVKSEEGLHRFIKSFETYAQHDEGVLWGVETDGILVGFVAIMDVSYDPILFYAMHPRHRNQGYAKETISEVARHFIEKFPNLDLHTEVYNDNHASISILQSCGFKDIDYKTSKIVLAL